MVSKLCLNTLQSKFLLEEEWEKGWTINTPPSFQQTGKEAQDQSKCLWQSLVLSLALLLESLIILISKHFICYKSNFSIHLDRRVGNKVKCNTQTIRKHASITKKCESQCKHFTITYSFYNVWTTDQIAKKKKLSTIFVVPQVNRGPHQSK